MAQCKLQFQSSDNPVAFQLYEALVKQGVSCKAFDAGYQVLNYSGKQCRNLKARACTVGENDGRVEAEEVLEYALNNEGKYRRLIEGAIGSKLPWVLEDANANAAALEGVHPQPRAVIEKLREVVKKSGAREGTEDYKEKMALGLYSFMMTPDAQRVRNAPERFEQLTAELRKAGLEEFQEYLRANGGFYLFDDYKNERSALDALRARHGKCTEKSRLMYALMKMAGLAPIFIEVDLLDSEYKRLSALKGLKGRMTHVCVGLQLKGKLRLLDPSLANANPQYRLIFPRTLRQELGRWYANYGALRMSAGATNDGLLQIQRAFLYDSRSSPAAYANFGTGLAFLGRVDDAIACFKKAIEIHPRFADAFTILGGIYLVGRNDADTAIAYLKKAIAIDPTYAKAFNFYGEALVKKGLAHEAIRAFREALRLDPNVQDARENLEAAEKYLRSR
jgi:tetratricopeptide (TPR) repeat protein